MDINAMFKATGLVPPPAVSTANIPKKAKKHMSAAQVAQFVREREFKQLEKLDRIPWVVRQMERGIRFEGCGHSCCNLGVYVGPQYARFCFQCRGKGTQTSSDKLRNLKYNDSVIKNTTKGHYTQHNNEYMGV